MDKIKTAAGLVDELLTKMGINAKAKVVEEPESGCVGIDIDGEDLGLLIGHHGETLQALQLVVSLMLAKALGEWQPVVVDVGGWRSQREEYLRRMADQVAEEVAASGQEQELPAMVPYERRSIHLALADHPRVVTESVGDEPDRRVIVKPK